MAGCILSLSSKVLCVVWTVVPSLPLPGSAASDKLVTLSLILIPFSGTLCRFSEVKYAKHLT